uniref:Uncharacterized protein n=1 Tax=Anguilla anguilla TaxID=7936 RepID=A0A0E9PEC9_ANGAN
MLGFIAIDLTKLKSILYTLSELLIFKWCLATMCSIL